MKARSPSSQIGTASLEVGLGRTLLFMVAGSQVQGTGRPLNRFLHSPQECLADPPARSRKSVHSYCQAQLQHLNITEQFAKVWITWLHPRVTAEPSSAGPGLQGPLFGIFDWRGNLGTFGCSNCTLYQLPNQGSEGIQHRHPYYPSVGQFQPLAAAASAAAAIDRRTELSPTFG